MATVIATFLSLVLTNNLVMSLVKYLADGAKSSVWLRSILVGISILGVIAAAAISGKPIDLTQLSNLVSLFVSGLIVALASHFSYKVVTTA